MFEILFPAHGEILSRKSGMEKDSGLQIRVYGIARPADRVTVNGITAIRCGERFEADITLTEFRSTITVCAEGSRGKSMREIKVIYDKNSFRRANFCMDDNIFAFAEVARDLPESIFDHFYFGHFKKLHERYGLKLTLNLFYGDLRTSFTLDRFPDRYKEEWIANSDWLKLAFHAKTEFPDRPYQNAEDEQLLAAFIFILLCKQIRYFTFTILPVKILQSPAGTFALRYSFFTPRYSPVSVSVMSKP